MGTKIFGANRGIATSNVIPDNTDSALLITDTAGEQFMKITTTDNAEQLELGVGAGDAGEIENAGIIIREIDGSLPELQICDEMGFISDPDTMMRRKGANTIAFKTAGAEVLVLGPSYTDLKQPISGTALTTVGSLSSQIRGTFTATNTSAEITSGSSTFFTLDLHVGSALELFEGTESRGVFTVIAIDSGGAALTLDSAVSGLSSSPKTGMVGKTDSGELFAVKTGDSKTLFSIQPTGAIGAGANANSDSGVYNNIGIGDPRMFDKLTTGNALFVMGCTSGDYDFTTANACVVIGYGAAGDSTTSQNLVAIGSYAADSSTNIRECVIIGGGAGRSSGNDSVHIGHAAGASCTGIKNVSIGREALDNSSAATESVAVGYQSLSALTGAVESNTGLGFQSGLALTSGQQCTFLGAETDTSGTDGHTYNNQTAIGFGAVTDAANQVRVGNTSVGDIDGQVALTATSDARVKTNVQDLSLGLDFINALRPVSFSRVHPADWPEEIRDEQYKKGRTVVDEDGNETVVSTLSFDVETNQPIKNEFDETTRSDGLIAQEVKAVCETLGVEFNGIKENSSGKMGIQYSLLVAPLIAAVQELTARVSELEAGD